MIKFFDLYKQDKPLFNFFLKDLKSLLKKNDYILGESVNKLK